MEETGEPTITAILEGGPVDLPAESRTRRVGSTDQKVKVLHHGGYEHFELVRQDRQDDHASAVFRWTMRTRIAE
ncbi:DUF5988 family protein [Streptomyces sp. 4N509B]|uniref:DUF5988 family protein n=1 Tax=Streptomyces sp. 4N509B TaxID=3457413 RepID=UPI003FD56283